MKRTIFRFAATLLVPGQVVLGLPVEVRASSVEASVNEPPPPPPPLRGSANRTLPTVKPPQVGLAFSEVPTVAEVFRARVFSEPLVPIGTPTPSETNALSEAILSYSRAPEREDLSAFETFLSENPDSVWRASVLANLGSAYRRTGYFSKGLAAELQAWSLAKDEKGSVGQAVAGIALGELAELHARLGHRQELEDLIAEAGQRPLGGPASSKIAAVRHAVAMMASQPGYSYRCGPLAVGRVLAALGEVTEGQTRSINALLSTERGTNFAQLRRLAATVGLEGQVAFRESPSALPQAPAVVHWKAGHFAAIVRESEGRYLISDPTFGQDTWVSRRALAEETTGYFLTLASPLRQGWRKVADKEAARVWGKGHSSDTDPRPMNPNTNPHVGGNSPCKGMATYSFNHLLASLRIDDMPLGYEAPRGPSVSFRPSYMQYEQFMPSIPYFSNLGPKWTFDWLSWIEDAPDNPQQTLKHFERGGGLEELSIDQESQNFGPHQLSQAVVVRVSSNPIRYERRLPNGQVDIYSVPDSAYGVSRRVFLSETRDPQGDAVRFSYDDLYRLVALSDAVGQVTTLTYAHPTDPYKITQVTDPFGRSARIAYDSKGRVVQITDVLNLASQFAYATTSDLVASMTTPYGTTHFTMDETVTLTVSDDDPPGSAAVPALYRFIEATDPLGGKERLEFRAVIPGSYGIDNSDPDSTVPTAAAVHNAYLRAAASLFWGKRAMALAPSEGASAEVTHWAFTYHHGVTTAIPVATKRPLEPRVWFAYQGQAQRGVSNNDVPSVVGHVQDDGTFKLTQREHNRIGNVIKEIDPAGNETIFVWGTGSIPDSIPATGSGLDLLQVNRKQRDIDGGYDVLSATTYDARHQRLTTTDAAGSTTTYTYTPTGQIATVVTPPRNGPDGQPLTEAQRRTTYSYLPDEDLFGPGRLESVTGPDPGAVAGYTYDGYGRVKTTTDSDGYELTYDYDALDRVTKVTYPDDTYEETTYNRLDAEGHRDRLGKWTRTFHDALRRVTAVRDPLGRTTTNAWCDCGSLDKIIDANGNETRWEYDLAGRVIKEIRADGSHKRLVYDGTGRIKKKIDAKQQEIHYAYAQDGKLLSTAYVNAEHPTASVTLGYIDPATGQPDEYGRLRHMVDGTGTTVYTYWPMTGLGAGQLASLDGPLASDTVSYGYDKLGRVVSRALEGVTSTWKYDHLGRLQSQTDPIGTFTYTYDGVSGRVTQVTYPNGQGSHYAYFGNDDDRRLQEIHHKRPGPLFPTLSKFNYAYDDARNITTWTQQTDSDPAKVYDFKYDLADQLVRAKLTATTPKRYGYAYDPAGNRTAEQVDDVVTGATYDKMNRLLSQQSGGAILFAGTTDEAAKVTVQSKPTVNSAGLQFSGPAQVGSGQTDVVVQATDYATNPNTRTNTYRVTQSGATKAFTYDPNGNLTTDGSKTYEWDAENRLLAINQGTVRSEFSYNGSGQRTRFIEKTGSTVVADRRFVVCKSGCRPELCEERDAAGTVVKRFFDHGLQESGTAYFTTTDHLGSSREVTNSAGVLQTRYDYDPFGRRTKTGTVDADRGFTSHLFHAQSGLSLALHRAYSPDVGRWISADPAGLVDGANLYHYVRNNPASSKDRSGLITMKDCDPNQEMELTFAAQKAEAAAKNGCCLPKGQDPEKWVKKIRTATYHCGGKYSDCAQAATPPPLGAQTGNDVTFFDGAFGFSQIFDGDSGCGCLQGTVLHEMAHLVMKAPDMGPGNAYEIAKRCFKCAGEE